VTEHFDPDGQGPPAGLLIDSYTGIHFRRSVPDPILALFRDSQWTRTQTGISMLDEPIYSYNLVSPAKETLSRLALYGITPVTFERALSECRAELNAWVLERRRGQDKWVAEMQGYLATIDSIETLKPLVSARIEWDLDKMDEARAAYPVGAEMILSALHRRDPRLIVYACATVAPEANVILDLTELVSAEGVEQWWVRPNVSDLCETAVTRLSSMTEMPPVRVLTEGSTDSEFIQAAINILRPDVSDLITFFNPEAKPERNAAALAGLVKHFSAARVAHPVVALFDNDTAGHKERDTIPRSSLPPNIKIATLPDLASARSYPTLSSPAAPPGSIRMEDLNGRACSIEMYLGVDVLKGNGDLEPVQWSTGQPLQGALINKRRVQKRYREKVKRAQIDPSAAAGQDWDGMLAVIETILQAASAAN
jgi:hypothetical protein